MNIAILGYGTVGSGVKEILDHAATLQTKQLHVSHILIRKGKEKTLPYMCDDIQTILRDESVDVVVETMGGLEPAHTYILQALQSGKHVVTANKAVVAAHLKEFCDCARAHNVRIYFEASTGGGIPWIEGLAKAMRIDEVDRIHGIFNGTSNFILDHMQRHQASFEDVLQQAQRMGYAEADPSADIDGYDICNKLRISASLAYNCHISDNFPVFGIRNITKTDVAYFSSLGYAVRLIAKSRRHGHRYGCVVEPVLFETGSLESNTQDNYNLITLHGKTIGDLKFFGQGAGKLPTANAIVQDLLDLNTGVNHMDPSFTNTMEYDETLCLRDYVLRVKEEARKELTNFSYEVHSFEGQEYLHIQKAEVYVMHQAMKRMIKHDPQAFMASIYEREDE